MTIGSERGPVALPVFKTGRCPRYVDGLGSTPRRFRQPYFLLAEGLRPSDSPTRSLARRFVGALRSRGSLAMLARTLDHERQMHEIPSSVARPAA